MTRISVYEYPAPDDYGTDRKRVGTFDRSKAERWSDKDDYHEAGSGGPGAGQAVLRTATGKWVLQHWTLWQGQEDRHEFITEGVAREWLLRNDFDTAVEKYMGGEIEIEEDRRPGRPEIGGETKIRLGDELLDRADRLAETQGISRAELVRRAVHAYVRIADGAHDAFGDERRAQ